MGSFLQFGGATLRVLPLQSRVPCTYHRQSDQLAITYLKNDTNITILSTHKEGATILMDKADYKEKALQ